MFTLQILDRGQQYLFPLGDAPIQIGSGADATLRLEEQGVLPEHARLEPAAGGVRLVAFGAVRLNGRAVEQAQLALGDRIEIGEAVVVVGQSVTRQTRPDEVLADVPVATARRTGRTERKRSWLPFAAAGLLLAGIVAVIAQGDDTGEIRDQLAIVARFRESAMLDEAEAAVARLRQQWASAADDRLQQLEAEQARLDAIRGEIDRLTALVLDPANGRTYAQWTTELRRLEDGNQPITRVAARLVRSSLRETLERRPRVVATPSADEPAPREPEPIAAIAEPRADETVRAPDEATPDEPPEVATAPVPDAPSESVPAEAPVAVGRPSADTAATIGAEVERLAQQGLFAQGIAVLQDALAAARDEAQAAELRRRLEDLRGEALRRLQGLVAEADRLVALRRAGDAMAMLAAARFQYPTSPEFDALPKALARAQTALTGVAVGDDEDEEDEDDEVPASIASADPSGSVGGASASLLELRSHMDAIRTAEEAGAFATAARLLREAAVLVHERDPAYAARLEARAVTADLCAAWHDHVASALAAGRTLKVTTRAGRAATLRAAADGALLATNADGDTRLSWHDVSAFGLSLLVGELAPSGRAALGAAALGYEAGDRARAEALLARVLPAEPALKPLVDAVLARGRGEPVDERGYTLTRDGFVSVRAAEIQKEVQRLAARLDGALRDRDPSAREALVAEAQRIGPDALVVLTTALQQEFERQIGKIEANPLKKQVEKLAAQRAVLDAARDAARALIYDEVRYFYPYKPPAVSSDRFAEYNRVQAEVDQLVAALRAVWKDDRVRARVPASLRGELDRVDWIARTLGRLGPFDTSRLDAIEWARALPPGETIGVRDHCRTVAEREERVQWRRIEAYNAIAAEQFDSAVREQLRITNEYRAMFGHRPLALVPALCAAAQGHADEMTRLGYFAHVSPTPGRRTPYDRMQLAGYPAGASENIALCDSASTAHFAWCHSSGHHRNLLDPSHHEIGIGADGRNWVQNFGSGLVHETEAAWQQLGQSR